MFSLNLFLSRFGKADIKPALADILTALFKALETDQSKENDYVMKGILHFLQQQTDPIAAIMRVVSTAAEEIIPYSGKCVQALVTILAKICRNPTNPSFNHYLFETIGALIKSIRYLSLMRSCESDCCTSVQQIRMQWLHLKSF